jgi:hypothetical protein
LKDFHILSSPEYEKVVFGMLSACMNVCPTNASKDKSWITTHIKKSCQPKRILYNISKYSSDPKIKLHLKKYCHILRKVICEAKKQHCNQLIETSNNRIKHLGIS